MPTITYPLDITGVSPLNLVTDEQHAVTEANFWNYNFIVPHCAPFFITNLKVRHYNLTEVVELVEGIDYFPTLQYIGATRSIGRVLYGAITLNRTITSGIVSIDYQTLGGEWIANRDIVLRNLAEIVYNPRLTVWETVTDKQAVFPPMDHPQDLDTLYGLKELIDSILGIGNVIIENRNQLGIVKHLTNHDNPHRVTKDQLGIPRIGNWGMATEEQIDEHIDTESLINPSTLHYALSKYQSDLADIVDGYRQLRINLDNHMGDLDAHGIPTIKSDISEIETQINTLNDHITNYDNPHQVTKATIGLDLVENIPLASDDEVRNRDKVEKHITLSQLIDLMESWGGTTPTTEYSISTSTNIVNEADTIYCTVVAPNSSDGTVLYWSIGHISTTDDDFSSSSGSMVVISGQAVFSVQVAIDPINENDEYFTIKLRKDSDVGQIVASTGTIKVINTNSNATYQLYPLRKEIDRGTIVPVTISTTDVPNGYIHYWTIEHLDTSPNDFITNNGVVQIVNNLAVFNIEVKPNSTAWSRQQFRLQLRLGSVTGAIVATSDAMYLKESFEFDTFLMRSTHLSCQPKNVLNSLSLKILVWRMTTSQREIRW